MAYIPENIDFELTKIWIAQQDLSDVTPEGVKELFFDALHKISKKNIERWD